LLLAAANFMMMMTTMMTMTTKTKTTSTQLADPPNHTAMPPMQPQRQINQAQAQDN
jgi:hypothetical protein